VQALHYEELADIQEEKEHFLHLEFRFLLLGDLFLLLDTRSGESVQLVEDKAVPDSEYKVGDDHGAYLVTHLIEVLTNLITVAKAKHAKVILIYLSIVFSLASFHQATK